MLNAKETSTNLDEMALSTSKSKFHLTGLKLELTETEFQATMTVTAGYRFKLTLHTIEMIVTNESATKPHFKSNIKLFNISFDGYLSKGMLIEVNVHFHCKFSQL